MDRLALSQVQTDYDRLRGRLFQFTEALGLPSRQEDAVKGVIRSITYDSQRSLERLLRENGNGA